MVFYLKVNRYEPYTYNNLNHWINAIKILPEYKIYIVCDNNKLKKNIKKFLSLSKNEVTFIKSIKSREMKKMVRQIIFNLPVRWERAAYAHLTTFLHAKKNNISRYWNIDADDTLFCLSPERSCECLSKAKEYAEKEGIHLFSLDFWVSRNTDLWTFGITYTNNEIDWINIIKKYSKGRDKYIEEKKLQAMNVDMYFGYIKSLEETENAECKIRSFYFENLKFIHYSNDFIRRSIESGMFHYKDGKIFFPILYYCFDEKSIGLIPIKDEVIKLDVGIMDSESGPILKKDALDARLWIALGKDIN